MPRTLRIVEAESTLTSRYQTTVPESIRDVLHLSKRDKIHYTALSDGSVLMSKVAPAEESDPVLEQFLDFLATDIRKNPHRLQVIDPALIAKAYELVGDCSIDLEAPLSEEDE